MEDSRGPAFVSALQDFGRARRRATLREVLGTLTRRGHPLMNFEDVRRKLKAVEEPSRILTEVPLDRIVGSVGRYNDFTREFLPRQDSDKGRWVAVQVAMTGLSGLPPVELYRIGDAYFVRDGNHRVSVARQLGMKMIQAWVTSLHTRVHLPADVSPDGLIIKAEESDFLESTRIDELRPDAELTVTAPGQYDKLAEHIGVHRYFMGLNEQRDVSEEEAVTHWYDTVYLPVVREIAELDLLDGFPGRTVTDLYLWLGEHRGRLWRELGFRLPTGAVAEGVARTDRLSNPAARADFLAEAAAGNVTLYRDLLVGLDGAAMGAVFSQALLVAGREKSAIYALHMDQAGADHSTGFAAEAAASGVEAQFVTAPGNPAEALLERSLYSDLIVLRNDRSARSLVRRCRRPILLVNSESAPFGHLLLAFDGRRRSEEAMFHAAYLALAWGSRLSVVTVAGAQAVGERTLAKARTYLSGHGVTASYLVRTGPVTAGITQAADEHGCDTIVLGSYKYSSWLETVLGGIPDEIMNRAGQQLLIV